MSSLYIHLDYKGVFDRQQQEEEEEYAGPHLILSLRSEVEVEGDIISRQVESRHNFNDCSSSFLNSFIKENEPLPLRILMNSEEADMTRVTISNKILYLINCCVGLAGLKKLHVDVIYMLFEEQEENNDSREEVDVLRERRMALMQRKIYSSNSSMEEKEVCAVCLEEMGEGGKEVVSTPCSHQFHAQCVGRWFENSGFCPLCRFQIGP